MKKRIVWGMALLVSSTLSTTACADSNKDGGKAAKEVSAKKDSATGAPAKLDEAALVAKGAELYKSQACSTCHSTDGSRLSGPSFKGLAGSPVKLTNGKEVKADDAYLRESIENPTAHVTDGFLPLMPPYKGRLKPEELDALVAWLKTQR